MSEPRRAQARVVWRPLDGILLLDKPLELSSNQALQQVRRLFRAAKAGHTGSLDPLATGMLPVCFGHATKLCAYLLDSDKVYRARLQLGARTNTADAEGEVVETAAVPAFSDEELAQACANLTGAISQVPPMYSALKHEGERLYALARRGVEVLREARDIQIFKLTATRVDAHPNCLDFTVHCSKGTYVRTLGEDLAQRLSTVGHLIGLHRQWVAPFSQGRLWSLPQLQAMAETPESLDACLLPMERALPDWPLLELDDAQATSIRFGRPVASPLPLHPAERQLCLMHQGRLLALGAIAAQSPWIAPFRLFVPGTGT